MKAKPYPMLPQMGLMHGALGSEIVEFLQGKESAEQALKDVEAAYMSKAKEQGFFDFDLFSWMAGTWQTAAFFIFIALCITVMLIWEKKGPGGSPRKGILGLDTTRGERLCVSL